jgi:hypothetical protein
LKSILNPKNPSAKLPALWHFIFPITESFEKVLKISANSGTLSPPRFSMPAKNQIAKRKNPSLIIQTQLN